MDGVLSCAMGLSMMVGMLPGGRLRFCPAALGALDRVRPSVECRQGITVGDRLARPSPLTSFLRPV